jgi:hypothetical protein
LSRSIAARKTTSLICVCVVKCVGYPSHVKLSQKFRDNISRYIIRISAAMLRPLARSHAFSFLRQSFAEPNQTGPLKWLPSRIQKAFACQNLRLSRMCIRIIHIYSCSHVNSADFVPCASSRGEQCSTQDIKTKHVKHESKCDECQDRYLENTRCWTPISSLQLR